LDEFEPFQSDGELREAEVTKAKEQRLEEAKWQAQIEWIMGTPDGRAFMAAVLARSGWDEEAHDPKAEGSRRVGVFFWQAIKRYALPQFVAMVEENPNP
jgi:hypothetical protein